MSEYLLIKKVFENKPVDQTIIVKGWVKSFRQSKKFSFLMMERLRKTFRLLLMAHFQTMKML